MVDAKLREKKKTNKKKTNKKKKNKDIRSDPSTYGQKWVSIHDLSSSIVIKEDIEPTLKSINTIINKIGCSTCREDSKKYLYFHDIKKYYKMKDDKGRLIGVFVYFVEFHNYVNEKINKEKGNEDKKNIDVSTAIGMYYPENETDYVCSLKCGK